MTENEVAFEVHPLYGGYAGYKFRPVGESRWDQADSLDVVTEVLGLELEERKKLGGRLRPKVATVTGRKFFDGEWSPPYQFEIEAEG